MYLIFADILVVVGTVVFCISMFYARRGCGLMDHTYEEVDAYQVDQDNAGKRLDVL